MGDFWYILVSFVEAMANFGAGATSAGMGYEPEVPDELRK